MEPKKLDHNSIVAKDNSLIGTLAKFELSELRLLAFCLAHYDSRSEENIEIVARVDDLKKTFEMTSNDAYAVVRRAMIGINKKPFEHVTDDDALACDFWFSRFTYQPKTGMFKFKISPDMQPYLLALQGTFTQYRLKDVYQFKAASTWKLYENLAQWRTTGRWAVSLDELRLKLGVAGKYPRWSDFDIRVTKPAVAEINAQSDIRVEYHQEKRGRRIVGLVFLIDKKEDDNIIVLEPPEDTIYKALLGYGIHEKTAADYAKNINRQGKVNQILDKLPAIVERAKKSGQPIQKYIIGAINKDLQQGNLFDESEPTQTPSIKIVTGLQLRHRYTGQVMTVEDGNVIRFDSGIIPEGIIRQYIKNGIFVNENG